MHLGYTGCLACKEEVGKRVVRVCATVASLSLAASSVLFVAPAVSRPEIAAVVNAASSTTLLAPGCWAVIYGKNLSASESRADAVPLPTRLSGVTVTVAGVAAPLLYVSNTQINALIPFEVPPSAGASVSVVVTAADGSSDPYYIRLTRHAPGIFTQDSSPTGPAHVFDANFAPAQTVVAGAAVIFYATGLGPVDPPAASGTGGNASEPLQRVIDRLEVYVGDERAEVLFAGLAPELADVYQVNVKAAEVLTDRLFVRIGGWQSNITRIGIKSGENVANASGAIQLLYPPRDRPADASWLFEAARFNVSFDILPGARPFAVAAVSAAGRSIIRIDPARQSYEAVVTLPAPGPRVGDFSGVSGEVIDFASCDRNSACRSFPGNKIPAARLDGLYQEVMKGLPEPSEALVGEAHGLRRISGAAPPGMRFVIDDRTNSEVSKFGGFLQVQFGPFPRISDVFELYVDGRLAASRRVSHSLVNLRGPPPLAMPAPGESYVDPVFGSKILRVSGPDEGQGCVTVYSIWPSFNADSTALVILCDPGGASTEWVVRVDPVNLRVLSKQRPATRLLLGAGTEWSRKDPSTLYFLQGNKIAAYNIQTRTVQQIKDFTPVFGPGYLFRLTMSDDENVFCFVRQDSSWRPVGFAVWRRSDNRILFQADMPDAKPEIDKSGTYVMVGPDLPGYRTMIVNVLTGAREYLVSGAPDFAPGHGDSGAEINVAWDNWENRILLRRLEAPHSWLELFRFPYWGNELHISLLSRDESFATVSTSIGWMGLEATGLYRDEIFQVATDGSGRVRRLAHTRSDQLASGDEDYWDLPRANTSLDGRFVAFTSNWGSSRRRDVYVLQVPRE